MREVSKLDTAAGFQSGFAFDRVDTLRTDHAEAGLAVALCHRLVRSQARQATTTTINSAQQTAYSTWSVSTKLWAQTQFREQVFRIYHKCMRQRAHFNER